MKKFRRMGLSPQTKISGYVTVLISGYVTVFFPHQPVCLHKLRVHTVYSSNTCSSTRSTQPCIPPGSLNRVPASAGVRVGMSPLPGGR